MLQKYARALMNRRIGLNLQPKHSQLLKNAAWVAAPFALSQFIRLGTSVAVAWFLAPELIGLMLLINTLRTGAELLTDVGIGQSIVGNKKGNNPDFYNTAWTIQIIRGIVLFFLLCAAAGPAATIFENPQLNTLLPAVAPIFLLTGFTAPSQFLLQKSLDVRTQSIFDLSMSAFGALVHIALAWAIPTIWALIIGLFVTAACSTAVSYVLMDWRTLRFKWDGDSAKEIFLFGRWIFLSSIIYFLSINFDRLYFASIISLSTLGIYGIARTFSESILMLFFRFCQIIAFPMISAAKTRGSDLRRAIQPIRFLALMGVAIVLAVLVAVADEFIELIYDARYEGAGIIMTILLFGAWFAILSSIADAIMMGIGEPAGVAVANGTKLLILMIGLPLTAASLGFAACLGILVFAELFRYMALMVGNRRLGLGFSRQDLMMTILFIALAFIFRQTSMLIGLTGGVASWVEQVKALNVLG
jgi:O-antigen/teichoic acid export membrane protein